MLSNLRKYDVILGSKSPRRRELLQMLRVPFKSVVISGLKEEYPDTLAADDVPEYLSELKASAYIDRCRDNELVITADTLVICDDCILGKPKDSEEAVEMLMTLSGRTHHVVTGVTLATKERTKSFTTSTEVRFARITDEEARYYVENFSPLDKAGAYGIQEWIGCVAVESIHGSYYNVMGLPVHRLYQELKQF